MSLDNSKSKYTSGNHHDTRDVVGKFVSAKDLLDSSKTINTVSQLLEAVKEMATSIYRQEKRFTSSDILSMQRIGKIMLDIEEHREAVRRLKQK